MKYQNVGKTDCGVDWRGEKTAAVSYYSTWGSIDYQLYKQNQTELCRYSKKSAFHGGQLQLWMMDDNDFSSRYVRAVAVLQSSLTG